MEQVKVTQLCPTFCDPMDCSQPGSSVNGILQARILQWVGISFSRGSSQPRDQTQVSCIAGRFFTSWAIREAQIGAKVYTIGWRGDNLGKSISQKYFEYRGQRAAEQRVWFYEIFPDILDQLPLS